MPSEEQKARARQRAAADKEAREKLERAQEKEEKLRAEEEERALKAQLAATAASGLFSAVMIGLGRAVGETMIVLMAAGNTPIMDWDIFSGFQTLSATIATELPEATQGSTHYRILFLAAVLLFVLTFFINTVAEVVRQRFRRRAHEL